MSADWDYSRDERGVIELEEAISQSILGFGKTYTGESSKEDKKKGRKEVVIELPTSALAGEEGGAHISTSVHCGTLLRMQLLSCYIQKKLYFKNIAGLKTKDRSCEGYPKFLRYFVFILFYFLFYFT
jgi:hypothetical protein